ncbi:hypothetical protein XENOCAPTIV_000801, partial [Xenoophorus captivus]
IRSLVHQRGEQDRRLLALEEDLKKAEAKLLAAVREKTGLSASVITLERQRAELTKAARATVSTLRDRNKDLGKTQEEGFRRVEELKNELNILQQAKRDERKRQIQLEQEHMALTEELAKEKLHRIFVFLFSTKETLKEARGRQGELEAEVGRVTCQLKEAMDKMVEQKEEEINRVRGMLLEVEACLAQKVEEMKAAETSHAAEISLLQMELQMRINEKEKVLECLEEQRNQSVTELKHEREKAQQQLEELSQQKEQLIKQLQEEREGKVKIHAAFQEEKGLFGVERNNHEQVRSEVLRLQAELEKLDEERRNLLSEVELKKEFSQALENQLNRAEQDRDQFQSRHNDVEQENIGLQVQLIQLQEKMGALEQELEKQQQESGALREQVEALTQEKVTLQWEMEEQRRELRRQLAEEQEKR